MELRELSQELDEGALSKRMVGGSMECDGRVSRREMLDISCLQSSDVSGKKEYLKTV